MKALFGTDYKVLLTWRRRKENKAENILHFKFYSVKLTNFTVKIPQKQKIRYVKLINT
jgi:hypothetical protein